MWSSCSLLALSPWLTTSHAHLPRRGEDSPANRHRPFLCIGTKEPAPVKQIKTSLPNITVPADPTAEAHMSTWNSFFYSCWCHLCCPHWDEMQQASSAATCKGLAFLWFKSQYSHTFWQWLALQFRSVLSTDLWKASHPLTGVPRKGMDIGLQRWPCMAKLQEGTGPKHRT